MVRVPFQIGYWRVQEGHCRTLANYAKAREIRNDDQDDRIILCLNKRTSSRGEPYSVAASAQIQSGPQIIFGLVCTEHRRLWRPSLRLCKEFPEQLRRFGEQPGGRIEKQDTIKCRIDG